VKVEIYRDERWPDYGIFQREETRYGQIVDIPEELFDRYTDASMEYDAVQDLLSEYYKNPDLKKLPIGGGYNIQFTTSVVAENESVL